MAQVKVWNDNVHPYKEKFHGDEIVIKPKEFVLMNKEDADLFLGTMNSLIFDVGGRPKKECYKMLRIDQSPIEEKKAK